MNLQNLNDKELITSFHEVVKTERKIMHTVILHVQEITRRKLHLGLGYGSLYEYLVKELKYSGSAAQRRIEASRLLNEVPKIAESLQSGKLNLSQICDIQKAVKELEKVHQNKVSAEAKAEIVNQVLGQNTSSTRQICAEALDIPVVKPETVKTQKDKSRRIEITLSEKQYQKYEMVRDLLAHKNFQSKRTQSMTDVFETIFDELIALKRPSNIKKAQNESRDRDDIDRGNSNRKNMASKISIQKEIPKESDNRGDLNHGDPPAGEFHDAEPGNRRVTASVMQGEKWNSLTPKRKNLILLKDQCCQYQNPETGKVCGSTFNLHIDHIMPKRAGGENSPGNLRVLCREHNLFREFNFQNRQIHRPANARNH